MSMTSFSRLLVTTVLLLSTCGRGAWAKKGGNDDKHMVDIYNYTLTQKTSRVLIQIPAALHNESGEEHVFGLFSSSAQSVGTLAAAVHFTPTSLCKPISWRTTNTTNNSTTPQPKSPFVLMASNAGPCHVKTKARLAQQAGAAALVLADTVCRCSDANCTATYSADGCHKHTPPLTDDGSGADVSIPVFLLYKTRAQQLIHAMAPGKSVLLELQWGLVDSAVYDAEKDDSDDDTTSNPPMLPFVTYHFWTTAHDPVLDYTTYQNMKLVSTAFSPLHAVFEPRFSIINGSEFGCATGNGTTNTACDDLCTNEGRYCATAARNLTGFIIVKETLRRLCIWEHYGKPYQQDLYNHHVQDVHNKKKSLYKPTDDNPYWDYLLYHLQHCSKPDKYDDKDCVDQALAHASVDHKVMDHCLTDTGALDQDTPNSLLDDALRRQKYSSVTSLPALTVNRQPVSASSWQLFHSICNAYWAAEKFDDAPDICYTCSACSNVIGCIQQGKCVPFTKPDHKKNDDNNNKNDTSGKKQTHHVRNFFLLCFLGLAAYGGWYYYTNIYAPQNGFGADRGGILNDYLQLNTDG